ncbi:hypothetical protein KBC77_03745, partial [Candidatus Saccharibacteria bacterium]|nr:hypothetical protein [Candidatus Saccharibacteria bacterium]
NIHIGQSAQQLATVHDETPIDWYVYSSAVAIENPNMPEFVFCREHAIRMSKRDELLNEIISQKNLKLIAIAGTHGKTTTTAMAVWLCQQIGLPISYTLAAKTSFAEMAHHPHDANYFVYECDEYDRNFLHFYPHVSLITGIDWDHPDIFPTRKEYVEAFEAFVQQSSHSYLWSSDALQLSTVPNSKVTILQEQSDHIGSIALAGEVNRRNAWQVASAMHHIAKRPVSELLKLLEKFPGVSRRFERIADGLYTDYAHTPPKIRGALQLGHEIAGENLVVVYEGLHNTRQHFISDELIHLFDTVKHLYIVPSYLAREDESLDLLTPEKLRDRLSTEAQEKTTASQLDTILKESIKRHIEDGDTVVCLSAGGGDSLDEWLRRHF